MNRKLTAVFAALEALLVVGIGIGIPLVPLTLMWAFQYGLQVDWLLFWRAAVDIWLLGHGVNLSVVLDAKSVSALGLPGAATPFAITLAPLAFAIVTVLLGTRAGRRIGETPHLRIGQLAAVGVFGTLACLASVSAVSAAVQPAPVAGCLLPTLVFAVGIAIGSGSRWRSLATAAAPAGLGHAGLGHSGLGHSGIGHAAAAAAGIPRPNAPLAGLWQRLPDLSLSRLDRWVRDRVPRQRNAVLIAVAGGIAASALILLAAAIAVAVSLAAKYAAVITLYEGVHSGILGGVALTLGQLALIPNTIIWAAAWFVGPGFSIGAGSTVSPLGTLLGPIPAIPILGALPSGTASIGFLGLLVPVLAGFVVGIFLRSRLVSAGCVGVGWIAIVSGLTGLSAGVLLGALAALSGGAAGPGRLADVGPPWLLVGLWSALEVAIPVAIALATSSGVRGGALRWPPRAAQIPPAEPMPGSSTAKASTATTSPSTPSASTTTPSTATIATVPTSAPLPTATPVPTVAPVPTSTDAGTTAPVSTPPVSTSPVSTSPADDTVTAEIPVQLPSSSSTPVESSPEPPAASR